MSSDIKLFFDTDSAATQAILDQLPQQDQDRIRDRVLNPDGSTDPDRFKIWWANEIPEEPIQVQWYVKPLIKRGTLGTLYAIGGDGKTWFSLYLAACLASGRNILNFEVPEPLRVLYIDEEMGREAMFARVAAVRAGNFITDRSVDLPLGVISMAGFHFAEPKKNEIDYRERLHNIVRETKTQFLVIDNLRAVLGGGNENAAQDMYPVLHFLKRLSVDYNLATWLDHHANRLGGYSGHNVLISESDTLTKMVKNDLTLTLTVEKDRWAGVRKFYAEMNFVEDENGDVIQFYLQDRDKPSRSKNEFTPSEEFVLEFMLEKHEATIDEIKAHTAFTGLFSPVTAQKAARGLVRKGKIQNVNPDTSGGRGNIAVYRMTAEVREETSNKRRERENPYVKSTNT